MTCDGDRVCRSCDEYGSVPDYKQECKRLEGVISARDSRIEELEEFIDNYVTT